MNELIPNDNENFDTYKYDPADPVPTIGGTGPAGGPVVSPVSAGPKNQFEVEKRKDILVYTTPPLKNNIQITGPVKMKQLNLINISATYKNFHLQNILKFVIIQRSIFKYLAIF